MARQYVMTKVTADELTAVNDFLVDLFGDDPGTQEISLNAYVDGEEPTVATHSFSNMNTSAADATTIQGEMPSHPDCACVKRAVTLGAWGWADALSMWSLKPVVPVTP